MYDSPLDPALSNVWQPGTKKAGTTGKGLGEPGQAVMLVVNDQALEALRQAGIPYYKVSDFYGFRADGLDPLKNWWARFTGNPVEKKAAGPFVTDCQYGPVWPGYNDAAGNPSLTPKSGGKCGILGGKAGFYPWARARLQVITIPAIKS